MNDLALATADAIGRIVPPIDPAQVTLESSGHNWRTFHALLPKEMVLSDLGEPSIWCKVQKSTRALRWLDTIVMTPVDRSFIATAKVVHADAERVVLSKPEVIRVAERFDRLPETEHFRVVWDGRGYVVERKADGYRVTASVASLPAAVRQMDGQYART